MKRTAHVRHACAILSLWLAGAMMSGCSGPILRTSPAPEPPPASVSGPNRALAPRTSLLGVGRSVPAFELADQNGTPVSASELMAGGRGTLLVLLPSDNAAAVRPAYGWARQHLNFLTQQRIELVMITPHSVEDNARLAQREELRLAVLSDPGAWVMRSFGAVPQGAASPRAPHAMLIAADGRIHLSEAGLPSPTDAVVAAQTRPGQQRESIFQLF